MTWHYIRPNKRSVNPHRFVVIDTETYAEQLSATRKVLRFRCGVARQLVFDKAGEYKVKEVTPSANADELIDAMLAHCGRGQRMIAVAYNWDFDYGVLGLGDALRVRGWECVRDIRTIGAWHQSWRKWGEGAHKQPYRLDLFDLSNVFQRPLADIGSYLGVEKLSLPADDAGMDEWLTRCNVDTVITSLALKWWLDFRTEHDMGAWRPSLAATSMGAFRHRFMHHHLLHHDDELASQLEDEAYIGGRVEAPYLGELPKGTYTLVDVQALYPSVMVTHRMPVELRAAVRDVTVEQLRAWQADWVLIARVSVRTENPRYPYRREGRLSFPVGEFVTTLAGAELENALEYNYVTGVDAAALYYPAYPFDRWVPYWWAMRQEAKAAGDVIRASIIKRLMNALCGKWAQRLTMERLIGTDTDRADGAWYELDWPEGERHDYVARSGRIYEQLRDRFADGSVPAISACINAAGRMVLWSHMQRAGVGNVYYVDTDCLLVDSVGAEQLAPYIAEGELGALSVQRVERRGAIFARKWYELGELKRAAGVRRDAVWTDRDSAEQSVWHSTAESERLGVGVGVVVDQQAVHSPNRAIRQSGIVLGWQRPVLLSETLASYASALRSGRASSQASTTTSQEPLAP